MLSDAFPVETTGVPVDEDLSLNSDMRSARPDVHGKQRSGTNGRRDKYGEYLNFERDDVCINFRYRNRDRQR
jgi:hypothetical protein